MLKTRLEDEVHMTSRSTVRIAAIALASALVAGLFVVAPVSAESSSAMNSSIEKQTFARVNADRRAKKLPSFKSTYYLDKAAEMLAARLARSVNHYYPLPEIVLAPDASTGGTPDFVQINCTSDEGSADPGFNVSSLRFCAESSFHNYWKQKQWNYASIAIVAKQHSSYQVAVFASYPTKPAKTLYNSKPTIGGYIGVGSTLHAHRNSWSPSTGTAFSYAWFVDGEEVSTSTTYIPTVEDLGKPIQLSVIGDHPGYWAPERLSSRYTIKSGLLQKSKTTVTGSRNVGQTLTADPGVWAPAETTFTYQWLRSGHTIPGATSASYELVAADYGTKIDVKVTGSATGYLTSSTTTKTSHSTAHQLLDAAPTPVIVGEVAVGSSLSVDAGTWQPEGVALKYQWRLDGHAIYHATHPTYTVPLSAVGKKLTVSVTGSLTGYATAVRTSNASISVPSLPFTTEGVATITGTAAVGKTLTAHAGTWSPKASVSYRWYRDGVAISMATKSTYKVTSSSAGHTLTVRVTASRAGYTKTVVVSDGVEIP
jgi:hypothetical protein